MSLLIIRKIMQSPGCATGSAWNVLVAMADRACDDGAGIWASNQTIGNLCGDLDAETVRRARKQLINDGIVVLTEETVNVKGTRMPVYRIILEKITPSQIETPQNEVPQFEVPPASKRGTPLPQIEVPPTSNRGTPLPQNEVPPSNRGTPLPQIEVPPTSNRGTPPPQIEVQTSPRTSNRTSPKNRKEEIPDVRAKDARPSAPPAAALLDAWNENCGGLGKATVFSEERRRKCRARLARPDPSAFLDYFRAAVSKAAHTPFLCGENDRGWRATFDWFIANDTNAVKVSEGRYDSVAAGSLRQLRNLENLRQGFEESQTAGPIFGRDHEAPVWPMIEEQNGTDSEIRN